MSGSVKKRMRCAVYTRKSSEEGLDQDYNSINAQRDAGHDYIASQRAEGWIAVADDYDDPAYSRGNMERPALRRLMVDIEAGRVKVMRGKIRVSVEGRLISRPANNTPP
ncbi:recombinase family protein [Candidatus Nitrotoga fabula]|uniref:Resolvase/invertase-type recombinase catalytic domain-containing protein n=1 Tax=Candidatus Nitrotoga fabula TaxID=2182327 RepID=A0A916FB19_9PROT|nr:recombinase family protein [Candidatus Nitrotoga fabula]CAE6691011.1 Resolvase/invertase-type recombinase catalytic domain-containing protein [Candidatus Nitrotoga fabula]